jgi:hypothetical protein
LGGQVTGTMEPFQFFGEQVTGMMKQNNVTVSIFYLVSNENDETVTFCGNDAHLWV